MNEPTPDGLTGNAEALWRDVVDVYELRADELRVLEAACREQALIDRLELELVDAKMVVHGSQGQPVANPMVSEVRQHRMALKGLLGQLKLPDEDGEAGKDRSAQARDAANARWRRGA